MHKQTLPLLIFLLLAFIVACTPDAAPTPRPVDDDDDGDRPRTEEVEPTRAVEPTVAVDTAAAIQGRWSYTEAVDENFSASYSYFFEDGELSFEGYPPRFWSGNYEVVEESSEQIVLSLTNMDEEGEPLDDRLMTIDINSDGTLLIDGQGSYASLTTAATQTPESYIEHEPPPESLTVSAADFPTLPSVPSRPLVLMDHVGGAAKAVALSGDVAFAGEGLRVTAVSLTNPTTPTVLGRSKPLGGVVRLLALYLDAAYVVAEPGWIDVLDVSNPAQIRRIAQLSIEGEVQSMVVMGDFLYTTAVADDKTTLTAWDISGMVTAVPTATITLPTISPTRLTTTGELLIVSQSERIDIFDITQPGQPTLVGEISSFDGFAVNPALPLADGRLLLANEFFHQFNIANPAAVEAINSAPLGDFLTGVDSPRGGGFVTMVGDTAVVIDRGSYFAPAGASRLWAIDTATAEPTAQLVAELPFTANAVTFQGTLAVVAHERGLSLLDLANAASPAVLSELVWRSSVDLGNEMAGFAVGSTSPSQLFSFDLSDLETRHSFLSLQTPNRFSDVYQNTQFIIDPDRGLIQLDVTNPTMPQETAVIDPKSNTLHLAGQWLDTTGDGLQTFEPNDDGILEQIAVCEECYEGAIHKILVTGPDTLHLIGPDGIYIVGVAGPGWLVPHSFLPADFPVLDGVVRWRENATYYLGTECRFAQADCAESTLWALHTLRAHEPEVKNGLTVPGNARKLVLFEGLLWVMTVDGRFIPHILTDPFAPQMLGKGIQLPLDTTLIQTEVVGDRLFISHPDTGILVYQMAEE
ncbi:LVIVD repeat-containing protein [Candidatus Leptofilum sp.]|uniref:LVIVD repeat-containing protein n=1 Tax=Candidatus Leptofilum sp. TaxID=3241576 RepID=UPI003B595297